MSNPRHRLDPAVPSAERLQAPPIPLRSIDFDAVAPFRRRSPETVSRRTTREPSPTSTSDSLQLAHS